MSNLINKILESEKIFDADFFFCDPEKVGNFDFRYHTEKKISNSQVYCVTFTYGDNNYEVAIDNNFVDNLVNILNQ